MNWTQLLSQANVPEPPGYAETVAKIQARPKQPELKKKGKRKKR